MTRLYIYCKDVVKYKQIINFAASLDMEVFNINNTDLNKSIKSIIKNSNEVMNINVPMLFQMEEMLLFCGLSNEQLNNFLSSYKQQKIAPISLKALGAANNTIRFQFIIEAIIVCLAGGIIGIIVGLLLGYVGANI